MLATVVLMADAVHGGRKPGEHGGGNTPGGVTPSEGAIDGPPRVRRVFDGVHAVEVPVPSGDPAYTLCYVLAGDDGAHLIDPGWDTEGNRTVIAAALAELGVVIGDVRTVLVTHHHPDHIGLAAWVRRRSGAEVVLGRIEQRVLAAETAADRHDPERYRGELGGWGVPPEQLESLVDAVATRPRHLPDLRADRLLDDGDRVAVGGHRLRVVATPGHTDGHLCLIDDERRLLYTGDHILPGVNPGVGLGSLGERNPLVDYLESLERLAPYDALAVLPGHETPFSGLGDRRRELARHQLRRTREVDDLQGSLGDAPVWEYAARLTWTAGWAALRGWVLHSALRQTALHLQLVRSGRAHKFFRRWGVAAD